MSFCTGARDSSSAVAFDSPTSPMVISVGHVGFTVLPVPPAAAADDEPEPPPVPDAAVVELELEQAAIAVTVRTAAAASLVHMGMRGLRTYVPLRRTARAGWSPRSLGVTNAGGRT